MMHIQQDQRMIPSDLDGCFVKLEKQLKPEIIKKMRDGSEADMIQYHFGIGLSIRNNWIRPDGSRLAEWFNAQGIYHPDDMSGIILTSFWRHLNKKPIKLEEQIKHHQDYWKKQESTNFIPKSSRVKTRFAIQRFALKLRFM
jgi:hypothetical protein